MKLILVLSGFFLMLQLSAQDTAFQSYYEKSHYVRQDYSKGYILMTLEDSRHMIDTQLKHDKEYTNLDHWEKEEKITEELLQSDNLVKKLHFTLSEIK